ncbi:Two-component transcriptional response regulator, LuxR family [hydrothermal vent metagenome]|uniref:Two-component transcriptional response regulator, LuxR family n=1 Tax=hydrothermal vent metagenome TaxID=652676 RepID=A0A3B1APM5_9ZZZZ
MPELKRILYVEDEADIRAVAKIALEVVGGFELKACSSGQEALAEVADFGPDLLLLDVMMPGMDGPTTLETLWQLPELSDVPAIFMTAKVQPEEVIVLKKAGVLDVLTKPFDPMGLADQIRTIWRAHSAE